LIFFQQYHNSTAAFCNQPHKQHMARYRAKLMINAVNNEVLA